jgi:hypothetical protein
LQSKVKRVLMQVIIPIISIAITLIGLNTASVSAKTDKTSVKSKSVDKLLKETMTLGIKGKAINSGEFGIGSRKKDIIKKWGKPESQDTSYLNYEKRKIVFYIDGNGKVISLTTTETNLLAIKYSQLKKVLGTPFYHNQGVGNIYDGYHARQYTVEFHSTNMKEPGKLVLVNVNIF